MLYSIITTRCIFGSEWKSQHLMQTVYFQNDIIIGLDNFPESKWGCAKGLLVSSFVVAGDVDVLGDEGGV